MESRVLEAEVATAQAGRRFFISYARADRRFAQRLTEDLRNAGAETWLDEANIRASEDWSEAIEEGIRSCTEYLIILSPQSVRSKYVMKELDCAVDANKTIVPVFHRTCKVPFELRRVHYIDFRGSYRAGFAQLSGERPPDLRWWEKIAIRLSRLPWLRPFTAALGVLLLIATIAVWQFLFSPSDTKVRISDSTENAIILHASNEGGRSARFLGGSHRIRFGDLPIEDQELRLGDPATMSLVPGHRDVTVQLTADGLTPKPRKDGTYVFKDDLRGILREKPVTLETRIAESGGMQTRSITLPAERIQSFIINQYPDHVRGQRHVE